MIHLYIFFFIFFSIIEYEKLNSGDYEDSINKYNNILSFLLSSKEFSNLKNSDLKEITESTEIKISISQDKKLKVVSWCVLIFSQNPMCSNIGVSNNKNKSKIISINGIGDKDFGSNVQNDTIIKVIPQGKVYYILIGSNKCGDLCIQQIASAYSISNGNIVKYSNAFFDGKNYFDDVEFNYLINEYTKLEPTFKIENEELICPIFKEDKTKEIGSKTFKMVINQ